MLLTQKQYRELLTMLCPFCKNNLPDIFRNGEFIHSIPETEFTNLKCWAARIRGKIDIVECLP
jgi:hypothetical protein